MAGKADMVEFVAYNLEGLTKAQAAEVVDTVLDFITDSLAGGETVQLPGFGRFSVAERAERRGHNPATGKPMTIPASKVVRFKAGTTLKEAVNG